VIDDRPHPDHTVRRLEHGTFDRTAGHRAVERDGALVRDRIYMKDVDSGLSRDRGGDACLEGYIVVCSRKPCSFGLMTSISRTDVTPLTDLAAATYACRAAAS